MSSQQGPKAAPGQHSAHILLRFILREHQSTSANFLGVVGEGERRGVTGCWDVGQRRHPVPRFVGTIRQLYHEAVLRNFETRHRELPGSVYVRAGSYTLREAAREDLPQVPYSECVKESVAKAR